MDIVDELVIIGNWAKSCNTKEQLNNVDSFLRKKVKSPHTVFPKYESRRANYNLGVVDGIILTLFKTKFA